MTPSFPLLGGVLTVQLPAERTWKPAEALTLTPGGDWHLRILPTGESVEWRLKFNGLTAAEAETLKQFHHEVRGSYHRFRFCDPLRNLLAWSEDPTQDPWTKSSALAISLLPSSLDGIAQTARVLNLSGGEGVIRQAVGCSPNFPYSFSIRARSNSGTTIGLMIGTQRKNYSLNSNWQTCRFTEVPGGSMDQVEFSIATSMGGDVEFAGICAEFGSGRVEYRKSAGRQGLYSTARFKEDLLIVSSPESGIFDAEVTIVARVEE